MNWLKQKINSGEIIPEIEQELSKYDYQKFTKLDNPINQIIIDIMSDDFNTYGRPYTNIYQFKVASNQYYLCDRAVNGKFEQRRHICVIAEGKFFPFGFEIINDKYFVNNDCETIQKMGKFYIRVEETKKYDEIKELLYRLTLELEKYGDGTNAISLFSFPNDNIIGYYISGRLLEKGELDFIISLLNQIP